jgi:hypothetical protein
VRNPSLPHQEINEEVQKHHKQKEGKGCAHRRQDGCRPLEMSFAEIAAKLGQR